MNAKQAKRARAIANREANKRGLWKIGMDSVLSKWWRKLLAKFFPSIKKKYSDWVGRWYKKNLKAWARSAYNSIHDPDRKAFLAANKKVDRQKRIQFRKRIEEAT